MQFLGINLNSNQGNFLESITKKNKFNFESTTLDSLKKATQSCSIFIPEKESHNLGQIEDFLGLNLKHICILHDGGESYVNGLNLMAKSEKITTLLGEKYQFQNILEHETLSVLNYLTFEEWPSLFFFMDKFFKSGNNLLTDSYARYQAIEEVMKSSETFSVSTGVLNNLYSILDELLMNAIFDAHPTFSKTLRKRVPNWKIENQFFSIGA